MESNVVHIKNMVCDRCKASVSSILSSLEIPYKSVSLGEAVLERMLRDREEQQLEQELKKAGFSVLSDGSEQTVNRIKSIIIQEIYGSKIESRARLSEVLASSLAQDYSGLSGLFKKTEGMTIEKFATSLKIERAKELLEYGELNVNEIAGTIGYNSVSYFCGKFKKETGFTPRAYQRRHFSDRKGIDSI